MKSWLWWIRVLWLWWLICSGLTLALWGLSTRNGITSLLQSRNLELERWSQQLAGKFQAMEQLRFALLSADPAGAPAQAYFRIYALTEAPGWIQELLRGRLQGDQVEVRPLPPGREAGQLHTPLPPDRPARYWLTGLRRRDGSWAVASFDFDHLHGPWMQRQLGSWEGDLQVSWDPLPGQPSGRLRTQRRLATLLASQTPPLEILSLSLDHRRAVKNYLAGQAVFLAGAAVLLVSFAGCIHLAGRGLRREWDFIQARKHFNALVSHELRTPIAAIRMYTEILQDGLVDDAERVRRYHQIIAAESSRLGHLVENLLAVGSLENARAAWERTPVNLPKLLEELCAREKWSLERDWSVELKPVWGNREVLELVFGNLIQNALKYGVEARVQAFQEGAKVVVEVLDRGPGIPIAERRRIFEAYRRLPGSPGRGVGLGLALVQGLMQALGGQVEIDDRPGGGAIFRLRLDSL